MRQLARGADPLVQDNRAAFARWNLICALGVSLAILTGIGLTPVCAQRNVVEVSHPGGLMTVQVEDATIFSWLDGANVEQWQRPSGRFRLVTGGQSPLGGNPIKVGDEKRAVASVINAGLAGPATNSPTWDEFTSKLTISVDGQPYDLHVLGAGEDEQQGAAINYWPVPPQAGTRDIWGIGRIPIDTTDPNTATEYIDIEHRWTLVHDAVRLEYTVRNETGQTHAVGIRPMIDASFGQWTRDGGTIVLPSGEQILSERAIPDAITGIVPDSWVAFDRLDNPTVMLGGTLESDDVYSPGTANTAAGKPDEISWGRLMGIGGDAQWDFVANAGIGLEGEDWAYAVRWDEEDLAAGRSRRYVTYFGMGSASVDFDSPYALAAYSPIKLQVREGDDPGTPIVERFYLTDTDGQSPFPVYAYADNFSPSPLVDASVRINLPDGFELDPPTQSLSKSLGTLARNDLRRVEWTLRATVARPGVDVIRFTGPNGKTVEREMTVPVIPALTPMPSQLGVEMVSVPYEFADTSVEHVFADLGSMHVGGANGLARWSPDELIYRWFPHAFVNNVTPGSGYWLLNRNRETVYFPDDISPVPTTWEYSLNLSAGWNQLGTPFPQLTYFDGVNIIDSSGSEWTMQEAVARRLILGTVYSYDADDNEYLWKTELGDVTLAPYSGYWVYCFEDLTLLFEPSSLYTRAASSSAPEAVAQVGDWKAQLVVSGGGRVRSKRCFGMAAGASDGLDGNDVLAPPACLPDGVSLTAEMVEPGSGTRYMQDIRQAGSQQQEWQLAVATNATGEPISVRWPDLSKMPRDLVATLEDTATGEKRYMRTTNSYEFRSSSDGAARVLKIVVRARGNDRALVQSASVSQAGGGVALVYSLANDANVDLEVRNISGVLIRRIQTDNVGQAGVNTTMWDARNSRGSRVPGGRYVFRVTARSPLSGEQHSMVCSFQLSR